MKANELRLAGHAKAADDLFPPLSLRYPRIRLAHGFVCNAQAIERMRSMPMI
jgi:hypothetical protein